MKSLDELGVKIRREAKVTLLPFKDYFQGFENIWVIQRLFGGKTSEVIENLKVEFYSSKFGYMGVSDVDGHILISSFHLLNADPAILYLDIVHELHHVKQFLEGKKLFNDDFEYVDNPVEIEAYMGTVEEAKRIGMSENEIIEYLKIERITDEQHARLVRSVGLSPKSGI